MPMLNGVFYCVSLRPRATFGLIVRNGVVVESAPIGRRWAMGHTAEDVVLEMQYKGIWFQWFNDINGSWFKG
jgi:hypothetical protein